MRNGLGDWLGVVRGMWRGSARGAGPLRTEEGESARAGEKEPERNVAMRTRALDCRALALLIAPTAPLVSPSLLPLSQPHPSSLLALPLAFPSPPPPRPLPSRPPRSRTNRLLRREKHVHPASNPGTSTPAGDLRTSLHLSSLTSLAPRLAPIPPPLSLVSSRSSLSPLAHSRSLSIAHIHTHAYAYYSRRHAIPALAG